MDKMFGYRRVTLPKRKRQPPGGFTVASFSTVTFLTSFSIKNKI